MTAESAQPGKASIGAIFLMVARRNVNAPIRLQNSGFLT